MPTSSACKAQKAQPWKAHWPPADTKAQPGVEYGVEKGGVIVVDGTSVRVSPPRKELVVEQNVKQP